MESGRLTDRSGFVPAMLLALAILIPAINPIGFTGGGNDDFRYLEAARCWIEAGAPCLPQTHWQSRWLAVAPLALITGVFGESRGTVGIAPWLAYACCIFLVAAIGRAWFGRQSALAGAALFASTPAIAAAAVQPGIDMIELALQLTALLLATLAYARQSRPSALAAGIAAAMAVMARDTSILFCAMSAVGWFWLDWERRKVLLWAVPAFIAAFAMEPLTYALVTGDPMYRYRLSLAHVGIPSAELAASVDVSRSPIFNPDYIAGWRREAGVQIWWPIDPWLNLLASPKSGLLLGGAIAASLFAGRCLPPEKRRLAARLALSAALVAVGLVYALAIDPKPRMFFLPMAASAVILAAIARAAWGCGQGLVPAALAALVMAGGMFVLANSANTHALEQRAEDWFAEYPGRITIAHDTRSALALVSGRQEAATSGSMPLMIAATTGNCSSFGMAVVDRIGGGRTGGLCLLNRHLPEGSRPRP